jgi:hypothetical protein
MGSCYSCTDASDADTIKSISKEMQNYDFRIYPIPESKVLPFSNDIIAKGFKGTIIFVSVKS